MKVPRRTASTSVGFNMTPMIDVVFQLVIFFLVSSHLAKQETQMPLPLPEAASGVRDVESDAPRTTVHVLADGTILLLGAATAKDELPARLARLRETAGPELQVRVRGDRATEYRHVEPVLAACAEAGVWNVDFAVYRGEEPR